MRMGTNGPVMITDGAASRLLERLAADHAAVLGAQVIGFYVFGSLVSGGFDSSTSDVDTVVVLRQDLTSTQLEGLSALHANLVRDDPTWADRVEVVYLSVDALANFRIGVHPAARISPGELFHAIDVDDRWLIDWYQLREGSVTLSGPPPTTIVPPILKSEWIDAVKHHMLEWPAPSADLGHGSLAYAVLSACRALRTCETGDHVSKPEAARWAAERMPEHGDLIRKTLAWRTQTNGGRDPFALHETKRFLADVQEALQPGATRSGDEVA